MAGAKITVDHNSKQLLAVLDRLLHTVSDTEPVMMEIANFLHKRTLDHFDKQESPDGKAWDKVTPATQKQKNKGYTIAGSRTPLPIPGKTLHGATLHLRDTLHPFWSATEAGVSTSGPTDAYAAAHQFGTQGMNIQIPAHQRLITQAFGRELPYPVWANIKAHTAKGHLPARPFLGIGQEDEREILSILEDEILGRL